MILAASSFTRPFHCGGRVRPAVSVAIRLVAVTSLMLLSTWAGLASGHLLSHDRPAAATTSTAVSGGDAHALPATSHPMAGPNFQLQLVETGLPAGTNWTANLSGTPIGGQVTNWSTTKLINFSVPNGSYHFRVPSIAPYSPSPSVGNLSINGTNLVQPISFSKPPTHYQVTFDESGIPSGWTWVVIFNASLAQTQTSRTLSFSCVNGTYSYGIGQSGSYVPTPGYGNLTVSGADLLVPVSFRAPITYTVTFNETGLAPRTAWWVSLGGATADSTSSTVTLNVTNGSYPFVLVAGVQPTGYVSADSPGNVTVNGSPVEVNVTFLRAPYLLTFAESGLPSNTVFTAWVHGLGGLGQGGVGSFPVSVVNGTYSFWVPPVWGYLPISPTGNVTINGHSVTVAVGFVPEVYQVTFAESGLSLPTNWTVVVDGSEYQTSATSTISLPLGNGSFSFEAVPIAGYLANPSNGTVTVGGSNVTVSVNFSTTANNPRYTVAFSETGLPNGSAWNVDINGTYASGSGAQIIFNLQNGTYWFQIHAPSDYSAVNYFEYFSVDGNNLSISVDFFDVVASTYAVTFTETGLPNQSLWTVNLAGASRTSNSSTISFEEPNGSYAFSIASVGRLSPAPAAGKVLVAGAGQAEAVSFSPGAAGPSYPVMFHAVGLPSGTYWSVNLSGVSNGSTSSTVGFEQPNGSYTFTLGGVEGYTGTPASGPASVVGLPLAILVHFTANSTALPWPYHAISFRETGLPNGTGWGVVIGSSIQTSLTDTVTFPNETNGRYGYVVLAISGYTTTYSGVVTVGGTNVTVTVAFTPLTYPVIILEFGLANGTNWSVTIYNTSTGFRETHSSTSNEIVFELPNGTYSISVSLPPGYSFTLSSPAITVAGRSPASPTLEAGPTGHPKPGISPNTIAFLGVAGISIALLIIVVLLTRRSGKRPTRPPPVS